MSRRRLSSISAHLKHPEVTKTKMSGPKLYLIYQLGTNNWQREGEFAPGSGILHEAHHAAYNSFQGVKSYSLYPSQKQTPHPDPQIEIFHIDHQIPICESVSPVSNYRWHAMPEEEFQAYKARLEATVYKQLAEAENAEGTTFSLAIAHHTFLNALVLRNVLRRRVAEGKPYVPLACFVHGTALKMYVHEKTGDNIQEYPMRFLKLMQEEKVFNSFRDGEDGVKICYAISNQQLEALHEIFPEFPLAQTVVSPNGINQQIFHKIPNLTLKTHLATFDTWWYEGSSNVPSKINTENLEHMVVIVSKFANWKRIDALLRGFKEFQDNDTEFGNNTCLVIIGSGPLESQKELQDLAFEELGLANCFFLGPKPQPVLAELYTIADIGCFPSKNEPFGMVFVECLACGTPVIGANSGGPKDFVTSDVGVLVPETDSIVDLASSLAKAITTALHENWKVTKADAGMKLVDEKYSVRGQCEGIIKATKLMLKQE